MSDIQSRVLMVATVPSMIGQFNMNNLKILHNMGFCVDIAADFSDISVWPSDRVEQFKNQMNDLGMECIQLDFSRSPLRLDRHINSYKELLKLLKLKKYSFVHTHTPIASAIVRLATKKTKTKVIYTAHGFHFYKGAPIKNWLIFYPIEKILSKYTDVLITINQEDYEIAKRKFHAENTLYVPGVGIDITKINSIQNNKVIMRNELKLKQNDVMIVSVGELSYRKNHSLVIKALGKINNDSLHYFICGTGSLQEELSNLADEQGINRNVHFLGYRRDVIEILKASDYFIFPSIQEGLPVALMEAMACNCNILCSRIRGNVDLIKDDSRLFSPISIEEFIEKFEIILNSKYEKSNYDMKIYSNQEINQVMTELYKKIAR